MEFTVEESSRKATHHKCHRGTFRAYLMSELESCLCLSSKGYMDPKDGDSAGRSVARVMMTALLPLVLIDSFQRHGSNVYVRKDDLVLRHSKYGGFCEAHQCSTIQALCPMVFLLIGWHGWRPEAPV